MMFRNTVKQFVSIVLVFGFVLGVSVGSGAFLATDAFAQSRRDNDNIRELQERMNSVIRQLNAMQARLIEHLDAGAHSGGNNSQDNALIADIEVRLGALDRELRGLTGQLEQIRYNQSKIERDFERFKSDVELRFQDLEAKGVNVANNSGANTREAFPESSDDNPVTTEIVRVQTPEEAARMVEEWERQQAEAGNDVSGDAPAVVADVSILPAETSLLPEGTVEERYEVAFGYMRRGDFENAERAFTEFINAHPDHALAGNAQYWLGESYYARADFPNAASAFLNGYQRYGDGQKAPDNLLKLGMSLANLKQTDEACSVFAEIAARYPNANPTIPQSAAREAERNNCS